MIVPTPTIYCLVTGASAGYTQLNAFDGALLAAGIGNTNLIKVSSILPPGVQERSVHELGLEPGALVPVAYGHMESDIPGSMISAAVAAAFPRDADRPGLIMEYNAHGHREDAEQVVRRMAEAGMEQRGWAVDRIQSVATDLRVEKTGAVIAAVVLWR